MQKSLSLALSVLTLTAAYLATTPTVSASTLHVPESCVGGPCDPGDLACFEATCLSITISCGPNALGQLICWAVFTPISLACSAAPSTCAVLFDTGVCTGWEPCDYEGIACIQTSERYCPHLTVSACAGSLCPAGEQACAATAGDVDVDACAGVCDAPTLCSTIDAVCSDLQCDGWISTSLQPGACVGPGTYCSSILCYRLRVNTYAQCLILM